MSNKKRWSKPKLIVLARANPEEMVLEACKSDTVTNLKTVAHQMKCQNTSCSVVSPS